MISPQPGSSVYEQIAARLRDDIITGRLRPGHPLPSERTLQQQYGVARETARQAVALLRNEGLVVVHRGHGVLVRDEPDFEDLTPPPGSTVTARMPTTQERADHALPSGVPVFVVTDTDGSVEVFPSDRWRLRLPG